MPRSNKTSNVLKLLNLPNIVENNAVPEADKPKISEPEVMPPSANQSESFNITEELAEPKPAARRPRKAIVKYMKLEKLSEPGKENPSLKAIPVEDRIYVRPSGERQIISIPLMLINEQ